MRPAGAVFLSAAVANLAGVVATIVLAHLLTSERYGALGALGGLYLVVALPAGALSLAVVRVAPQGAPGTLVRWRRRSVTVGIVGVVVSFLIAPSIAHLLVRPSEIDVAAVLVAGIAAIICGIDRGVLQLAQNYHALSANIGVEAGIRLVAMVGLVAIGAGVPGAAIGMAAAEIATAFDARRRSVRYHQAPSSAEKPRRVRLVGIDVAAALVAFSSLAALEYVDLLVVDRLNRDAGSYAAISVVAKALPLAAIVVAGYVVGEAAAAARAGSRSVKPVKVAATFLGIPAVAGIVVSGLWAKRLLSWFFPASDLRAAHFLVVLIGAMTILSGSVIVSLYLLARGHRVVVLWLAAGAASLWFAVSASGGHPKTAAIVDLLVQVVIASGVCLFWWFAHERNLAAASPSQPVAPH